MNINKFVKKTLQYQEIWVHYGQMGSIGLANRLGRDIEGAFNDHVVHVLKSASAGKHLTIYSYCSIVCNIFSVM